MSSKSRRRGGKPRPQPPQPWRRDLRDPAEEAAAFYADQPQLIVCGAVGLNILSADERKDLLAKVDFYDAVTAVAVLQSEFDVSYTTTGDLRGPQLRFLRGARDQWVSRVRNGIARGNVLAPPRSTAQLLREIVEHASTDPSAEPIDRTTLVHLLLSISSEQNMRPEFAGDVPTPAEAKRVRREIGAFDLEQTLAAAGEMITDEIASLLFNAPLKLGVVLSNTYDTWFRPWPARVTEPRFGATPAEAFKIATKVEMRDVVRLGTIIAHRSMSARQVRFSRGDLVEAGASEDAIEFLLKRMALDVPDLQARAARSASHRG